MQKLETILILFFGSLLLLLIGGVLTAVYLWTKYETTILTLAAIVFVVILIAILAQSGALEFIHKMYAAHNERKVAYHQAKMARLSHKDELALHWQKQQDETRLRTLELQVSQVEAFLALQRFQVEQVNGPVSRLTTSEWLYQHSTGNIIAPPRPGQGVVEAGSASDGSMAPLPSAPPFEHIRAMVTPQSIPLCWTDEGPRMGTFRDLLSTGVIGKPERGKTTALLYYVCLLLMIRAEVWVWDLHGSMKPLRGLNYFDNLSSILDSVAYLNRELQERDDLFHQNLFKPPIVLLVDELPALVGRYNALDRHVRAVTPSPLATTRVFVLEARKWQGYGFLSGQALPTEVLPALTRDNLSSRIVFECSPDSARMLKLSKTAIDTMLPRLKGAERGTHIADYSTWSEPELADIPLTTEDDLQWVLERRQQRATRQARNGVNGYETASQVISSHLLPISTMVGERPENDCRDTNEITTVNGDEANFQDVSGGITTISEHALDTSSVSEETRRWIVSLVEMRPGGKPLSWTQIARGVKMLGGKYKLFSAVCRELGYDTSKPRG